MNQSRHVALRQRRRTLEDLFDSGVVSKIADVDHHLQYPGRRLPPQCRPGHLTVHRPAPLVSPDPLLQKRMLKAHGQPYHAIGRTRSVYVFLGRS